MFIKVYEYGWEEQTACHYCYFDTDNIVTVKPILTLTGEDEYGLELHKDSGNGCVVRLRDKTKIEVNMGADEFVSKYLSGGKTK